MAETITAVQARELIRRGRCAACGGTLVAHAYDDGGRGVACFACGREVATVAVHRPDAFAPYWEDRQP